MTLRQPRGGCLERQGHDCFERRGEIPAILESALSHTLAGGTTALLNPKSESGSSSCTLVKSAKTSSVVRPADRPGPGPAPSAWKPLAELRICPRILQANRVAHASHSCGSPSRLCLTHPTCPSRPKFQVGTCPKGFASFALFQTLLLQEGLTDTTSLRPSLPGSLKKQHDRTYLRLALTWKITRPVQPADERHGGRDRSRIQERSRSQLS
jgi:hypothetical protein